MRRFVLLVTLFFAVTSFTFAQNNDFSKGIRYLNLGKYWLADSLLQTWVIQHPADRNAWYNWAVTKFYLNDTVNFCKFLNIINSPFTFDKEAEKLYFEYCGHTDTTYLTKKFKPANKTDFYFYQVKEYHKYDDLTRYKIHSKRKTGAVAKYSNEGGIESVPTDLYAVYQIDSNNNKVYSLAEVPPRYPDLGPTVTTENKIHNLLRSWYLKPEIPDSLNLIGKSISFDIIVDKQGIIKFDKLIKVIPGFKDTSVLVNYLKHQCNTLKRCKPAKFRKKPVDYRINIDLDF